jgi:hypothetical protein
MKQCCKCKRVLSESDFYKNKLSKDGVHWYCKKCQNKYSANYDKTNPRRKQYLKEYSRKYYATNPRRKEYLKKYNETYFNEYAKTPKRKQYISKYFKVKYKTDENFRIGKVMRGKLYTALKWKDSWRANHKGVECLGCDINFFRKYISNQFQENMSWGNYGEWHLDHIMPLVNFDLTKKSEREKCFHYTNIQPLWKEVHREKSKSERTKVG